MARNNQPPPKYERFTAPAPPLINVGSYKGANFISVNTTLPTNPRLVDRSKLPNGHTAADYHQMFARLPKELEPALKAKGHVEVAITIDERGKVVPVDTGSRSAPHATYVSAMIRRNVDGTNEIVGIWGGRAGGGNNGAPAAMVTSKLLSTKDGKLALQNRPIIDAATFDWSKSQLANTGSLNRDPHAWEFSNGAQSTFIPYHQQQTHGVHKQSALGEHHSKTDTWGCLSGTEESFRARLNSRIAIMIGKHPNHPHDWGNALGIQNTAMVAASLFVRNRDLAASTLGKVYHLNPLMYDTGNPRYQALAQQFNIPNAPPVTRFAANVPMPVSRPPDLTAPVPRGQPAPTQVAPVWKFNAPPPRQSA